MASTNMMLAIFTAAIGCFSRLRRRFSQRLGGQAKNSSFRGFTSRKDTDNKPTGRSPELCEGADPRSKAEYRFLKILGDKVEQNLLKNGNYIEREEYTKCNLSIKEYC
jgi:hypothetical protein